MWLHVEIRNWANPSVADQNFYRSGEFDNPTVVETTYQDFHRNWVFGKSNSGENMKPLVMSERLLTLASTYLHG